VISRVWHEGCYGGLAWIGMVIAITCLFVSACGETAGGGVFSSPECGTFGENVRFTMAKCQNPWCQGRKADNMCGVCRECWRLKLAAVAWIETRRLVRLISVRAFV
jgi:hypothetical protein